MDIKDFVEEALKSSHEDIPWHLRPMLENLDIIKNGRKMIIDPYLICRSNIRSLKQQILRRREYGL